MWMTVEFTDVDRDNNAHSGVATVEVDTPPTDETELQRWATENLYQHARDGNTAGPDAGHIVDIVSCAERPDLVGREFQWV